MKYDESGDGFLKYYGVEGDETAKGTIDIGDIVDIRSWSVADGTTQPPIASR